MSTTSSSRRTAPRRYRPYWALAALFLGAFVVGTSELLVVGILNLIAEDVGVPVSTAGSLVTAYAVGVSIGGPVLVALTIRFGRRFLLWLSLAGYVGGNLLALLATGFGMLLLSRIAAGALHGLFIGVAFAVGVAVVRREHLGRAISVVFGGITVSHVVGVPLGTFIGHELGWRAGFLIVVITGVVALASTLALVPPVGHTGAGGLGAQARRAFAPRVLAVLGIGVLLLGGQFAALTYLAPFLDEVTGIPGALISVFLAAYGVANAVGTFVGGWAADRNASATLIAANGVLVAALGVLYLIGAFPVPVAAALALCGLAGFGLVPSLQYRVVTLAGTGRDLAAILPASAANIGIAVGSVAGGQALASAGPRAAVLTGVLVCALALPATWATRFLRPPADPLPQPDVPGSAGGLSPARAGRHRADFSKANIEGGTS